MEAIQWPARSNGSLEITVLKNRAFLCKLISLICCLIATVLYADTKMVILTAAVAILVPSFLTGFIIIDVVEMVVILKNQSHVFIEMAFAAIGFGASLPCGAYQVNKWLEWGSDIENDQRVYNMEALRELALGGACLLNALVLLFDFVSHFRDIFCHSLDDEVEAEDR